MRNYNLPIMANNMAPLVVGKNSEHQEETHGNLAGLIKRTDFPTVCRLPLLTIRQMSLEIS